MTNIKSAFPTAATGDTPTPGATCEQGGYLTAADSTKVCTSVKYGEQDCFSCTACPTTSADCKIGDIFYSDGKCSAEYASCMKSSPVGVVYMLTDEEGGKTPSTKATSQHGRIISLHDLSTTYGGTTPTWGFHMDLINALDASMKENGNRKDKNYKAFQLSEAFNGSEMTKTLKDKESRRNYCCETESKPSPYSGISAGTSCSSGSSEECATRCSAPNRPYKANSSNDGSREKYAEQCISQPIRKATEYSVNSFKGNWYLPAIGEMAYLIGIPQDTRLRCYFVDNGSTFTTYPYPTIAGSYTESPINKVNQTLKKLGDAGLTINSQEVSMMSGDYWSSTPAPCDHDVEPGKGSPINQDVNTFAITVNKDMPLFKTLDRSSGRAKFRAGLSF